MRKLFFLFFVGLFLSSVFAQSVVDNSNLSSLYEMCLNNYDITNKDCSDIYYKSQKVSHILNDIYLDNIDESVYIKCVKSQISKGVLDYTKVRDTCYNGIIQKNRLEKFFELFKVKCTYDLNNTNNNLKVSCKYILPYSCFKGDVELQTNDDKYNIVPVVKKKSDVCYDLTTFSIIEKTFELEKDNPIEIKNFVLKDSEGNILPLEKLFSTNIISNMKMSNIDKAYFGCIANYFLHYPFDNKGIYIETSLFTNDKIIGICKDRIAYSYDVFYDRFLNDKKNIKNKIEAELNTFMLDNSLENLPTFLDNIINYYNQYDKYNEQLESKQGHLVLNLDLKYLFERFKRALIGKDDDAKRELINEFKITLVNDLEDKLEIKSKDNLPKFLELYDNEFKGIEDDSLKQILLKIKKDIVYDLLDKETVLDLTNVDFTLTPGSLRIGDFSFTPTKPIEINDKNLTYVFMLSNDKILFSKKNSIIVETTLPLNIRNNNIYVDDKKLELLTNIRQKGLPFSVVKIELVKEDDVLVYVVSKKVEGYFLGLFKVNEEVEEKYNALNSTLYEVNKPWWDFLIVYPKSVKDKI